MPSWDDAEACGVPCIGGSTTGVGAGSSESNTADTGAAGTDGRTVAVVVSQPREGLRLGTQRQTVSYHSLRQLLCRRLGCSNAHTHTQSCQCQARDDWATSRTQVVLQSRRDAMRALTDHGC